MSPSIARLFALIAVFVAFDSNATPPEFTHERQLYLQAIDALNRDRYKDYRFILSKLKTYPLYPYLLEAGLRRQIDDVSKNTQSVSFLETYEGMPVATRLQSKWFDHLEENNKWEDISKFTAPLDNVSQRCIYQTSLYHVGGHDNVFDGMANLWVSRTHIPKSCIFLLEQWVQSGGLSNDLIWERIFILLRHSKVEEVKQLAPLLTEDERILSYLLLIIHEQPEFLVGLNNYDITSKYYDKVLLHGIRRLAAKDLELALDVWTDIQDSHDISAIVHNDVELYLARKMAYKKHSSAFERFSAIDDKQLSESDKGLMFRLAISSQSWHDVLESIGTYSQLQQQSDRLQYWRARAYEGINKDNEAMHIYASLALKQGYYGFLSADRLSLEYTIGTPTEYIADQEGLNILEKTPGILRARELFLVGQVADARREWQHSSRLYDNEQLLLSAQLSQRWGWHDRAIFALAKTPYKDAVELRFPLAHQKKISTSAERNNIEPAWVFALIRQESAFINDARSSSGAMGLMQLMPRTASQVARKLKLPNLQAYDLLDAKTNIRLGTNYLSGRYKYFNQHKVLATAAYNAGPSRVNKWLPLEGSVPADIWIDSIPYKETRNYVKNILAYLVIYEKRLGLEPKRMSKRMPAIVAHDV
ncbi:MAG: lytic transglycosylase domain-containing protein [Gammaproteobacteria bacterium]|nr:lytic transglycosylase domain-containing protein [Gammaproteobacteria bacterium]